MSSPRSWALGSRRSLSGRQASTSRAASPSDCWVWWPSAQASPTKLSRRPRTRPDVVALRVAEEGAAYHLRLPAWSGLAWIWGGQRFPPEALQAVDGRPLRILYPGRPGGGAGPDYLDAAFELGGELRRGDVELHVRASAWHGHGHATDPAYDRVALHVVFRADDGPDTGLHSGARAPVAALEPWLAGRAEELKRWLSARAVWQEPCRDARATFGDDAVDKLLREAGERRLRAKADAMRLQVAA